MFKKIFFYSITAAVLSALSCFIYNRIYFFATEADFSKVLNTGTIVGINLIACLIAGAGYWALTMWLKKTGEVIFNFAFAILSFASVIFPISMSLPLDVKTPELFPGLAVPMHFFPALAWFTIRPLFIKDKTS
jgi:hypothetical protein